MKKISILIFSVLLSFASYGASISLYDSEGNYYWGDLDDGNISLYDGKGNYYWGNVD